MIYSFSIFRIAKVFIPFRAKGPEGYKHFGNPSVLKLYITFKNHDNCSLFRLREERFFEEHQSVTKDGLNNGKK